MSFLVITHVKHTFQNGQYYAYGPYVREMNIWFKHVDSVIVVAPLDTFAQPSAIDLAYQCTDIRFISVPQLNFTTLFHSFRSCIYLPIIILKIGYAMTKANHIHLRCPGNMGLLGCFLQVLFPRKKKTAKYAGNWDWNSKQPLSYRMQQLTLRNTILTQNMQTLVYGEWPDKTKNILPFFTASYSEADKILVPEKTMLDDTLRFIFVGTLTSNKQPLVALEVFHELSKKQNRTMEIHFYGEGVERVAILAYCSAHQLNNCVFVHGNVDSETLKGAYKQSHFLLFFSKSEGWPKAVSEAMWWGCVPVTTPVSCVGWMLGYGERGILLSVTEVAIDKLSGLISNKQAYDKKQYAAFNWSRQYTIEFFETNIQKLITN